MTTNDLSQAGTADARLRALEAETAALRAALAERDAQLRHVHKMGAIGRLAGGVAHDFNNLLTVIDGYVTMVRTRLHDEDPTLAYLEEIAHASDRASRVVQQLLALSRREVLAPEPLDVNARIASVERVLRWILDEDTTLETALAGDLGLVTLDAGQLEQILVHLVVQARDERPGAARLRVETSAATRPDGADVPAGGPAPGSWVVVTVHDARPGAADAPAASIAPAGEGELAHTAALVAAAGGVLTREARAAEGVTYRAWLPRSGVAAPAGAADPPVAPRSNGDRTTVLLVDDDEAVREVVAECLDAAGYDVVAAADPLTALVAVDRGRRPIDLLLTDVVMPGMSGLELADRVRSGHPDCRILLMSGYPNDTCCGSFEPVGPGTPFLAKPFRPSALLEKVRSVMSAGA